MSEEDRYTHIDLIVKEPTDGPSWFDVIHELITQNCESVELEDGEWSECSCGMEHMGGSTGTLQQCYDHIDNIDQGLKLIDLARALVALEERRYGDGSTEKAVAWARGEIYFEEHWKDPIEEDAE